MEKPATDYILVPLGFLIMAGYHVWLLRRIIHRSITNPIPGINSVRNRVAVVKFFCLAAYLLAAFLLSMQTGRHYRRAVSLVIAAQGRGCRGHQRRGPPKEYYSVARSGSCFFGAMGKRGCYLGAPLCLWIIFGSIQMIAGCIAMVAIMYFLDTRHSDWDEEEQETTKKKKKTGEESVDGAEKKKKESAFFRGEISTVKLLEIVVVKD
ncbi:hypothetical protein KSP39_PZI021416 [Platanthera zijinensis]|uniref:Uncharacterized protein n=1 Tax=Platanthera zijinensis TaxID=2320716 RepID=A0AAP0FWA2_9ASPA